MSSIWRTIVIVLRFYLIWREVSAKGELFERNITLTWNESLKYCQYIGKVLFDVTESKSETILRNILNETDQTWVSATVEFSHFVKVPVCMGTNNQLIANKKFDTDIIGNCLKFCNGSFFAGLKDRDCFCFKDAGNLIRSMRCNSTCKNDPVHQCGGIESISLYEKVDKNIIQYIKYGYKECVYAKKTRQGTNLFTGSCVGQVADGAICEGGNYSACGQHNWTWFDQNVCQMDLAAPLTWMQTKKHCADIGGQLMNSKLSDIKMRENSTYWFGFYRIPMIHKAEVMQLIKDDTYCAVARREGDLVLIEGEDCFTKHAILCQDESLDRSSSSPQSTEKPIPGQRSNSEPTDGKSIYVVAAVSAMLLVTLVISALVCIFRKRRQQLQHNEIRAIEYTSEQHRPIEMRASTSPNSPFGRVHNETEPGQAPYEDIVLVRNERTSTMPEPGQSSSAQTNYEKLHTQGGHNKDNDLHFYDQLISE